jgi:hypothetical protein
LFLTAPVCPGSPHSLRFFCVERPHLGPSYSDDMNMLAHGYPSTSVATDCVQALKAKSAEDEVGGD